MPAEFGEISNISDDGSNDDGLSDDSIIMDDHTSDDMEDIMMFRYLIASRRSVFTSRPCKTSSLTGKSFMFEILNGHPTICHQMFRMQKHMSLNFCDVLKEKGLLRNGKKVELRRVLLCFL